MRRRAFHCLRHKTGNRRSFSIVIPNWNGRDLLEKYLPSVIASTQDQHANEIIVVDNGSEDGSAAFVSGAFSASKGARAGAQPGLRRRLQRRISSRQDTTSWCCSTATCGWNRDFLAPLLAGFQDEKTFAVSCQIFFSDPGQTSRRDRIDGRLVAARRRLRVRHRVEPAIRELFPCFYGGGGSCAFDRRKFLELGGFDELLKPFYLEDTDLGISGLEARLEGAVSARQRGVSRTPRHHRQALQRTPTFKASSRKTSCSSPGRTSMTGAELIAHFWFTWANAMLSWLFGDSPERANFSGIARAALQLPHAMAFAHAGAASGCHHRYEAFRRPLGGHFRDIFPAMPAQVRSRLRVLFVSPYPICPPMHGGGVFMYQTVRELARTVRTASDRQPGFGGAARGPSRAGRLCAHPPNMSSAWRAVKKPSGRWNRTRLANSETAISPG